MYTYKKILSFLLILTFVVPQNVAVFAADGSSANFTGMKKKATARILDNFKEKEKEIIFDAIPISLSDEVGIALREKQKQGMQQTLTRLDTIQAQYKEQKKTVTQKKLSLKAFIKELDDSIVESQKGIDSLQLAIAQKNRGMLDLNNKVGELQEKINSNKKALLQYVSYIYSQGERLYDDSKNDIDIVKSVLLNDGSLGDVISDMHDKTAVEIAGQNFVDMYRGFIKEFYYSKEKLKNEKKSQLVLRGRLVAQNNELEQQKTYKEQLLEETKGQEALFNKYMLEKQTKQNEIQSKISALDNEIDESYDNILKDNHCDYLLSGGTAPDKATSDKCDKIKMMYDAQKTLKKYHLPVGDNKLNWPLKPSRGISTYYRDSEYFQILGSDHEAVDIPAAQGTPIAAPAAGYVYFINPPTPTSYSYLAIKHPEGYVTVYGHVSRIDVKLFQFVEPGQIIGLSGGQPGTPGSGNMTSGAHLHFEVYQNRESIDPLRFMDVSYLSYDNLPDKYRYKFLTDLKARLGAKANTDKYQKFTILGSTEMERQKDLLERYASPVFQNWDMWVEESVGGRVDPSFTMCVGLAETGLGRHLKTGYNVGNIGNTDSGGTMAFNAPREGVALMIKTLNNRYLGKYQTIDKLSRWGNKEGPIYASSPTNWHNNVVRCLSALKGRFVEDDYAFRTNGTTASADEE